MGSIFKNAGRFALELAVILVTLYLIEQTGWWSAPIILGAVALYFVVVVARAFARGWWSEMKEADAMMRELYPSRRQRAKIYWRVITRDDPKP